MENSKLALLKFIDEEDWVKVKKLLENSENSNIGEAEGASFVILKQDANKINRTNVHKAVREHFGDILVTDTLKTNDKVSVRVTLHSKTQVLNSNRKKRKGKISVDWRSAKKMKHNAQKKKYVKFVLYKENMETHFIATKLAKLLSYGARKPVDISYAGTKDKRAVTTQFVTLNKYYSYELCQAIKSIEKKQLSGSKVVLNGFSEVESCLKLGELKGNYFTITIRNIHLQKEGENVKNIIKERIESLKTTGFLNYFGLQRFGIRASSPTYMSGLFTLSKSYKKLIELLFSQNDEDNERASEAKQKFRNFLQNSSVELNDQYLIVDSAFYPEVNEILSALPSYLVAEKAIAKFITKRLEDSTIKVKIPLFEIVEKIPFHLRTLFEHSLQSLLFNQAATARIKKYGKIVVVGDLVVDSKQPKTAIEVTEENLSKYSLSDVVLPLPGFDVIYPKTDVNHSFYEKCLKEVSADVKVDFKSAFDNSPSLSGAYRHIVVKVSDLSYKFIEYRGRDTDLAMTCVDVLNKVTFSDDGGESEPVKEALQLQFTLPQSGYATMLFRELMRLETDLESLKKQS